MRIKKGDNMKKIKKIFAIKNLLIIFSIINIVMYIPTYIFGFICKSDLGNYFRFEETLQEDLNAIFYVFMDFNYQNFPWTIIIIIILALLMTYCIIKDYRRKALKPSMIILYSCILLLNIVGYYFQYRYNFEIWSF